MTIKEFLFSNFGHCPKCMRTALGAAAGAWTLCALLLAAGFPVIVGYALILALALSALWSLHIVIYGLKTVANRPTGDDGIENGSRRRVLLYFAQGASFGALMSVMPAAAQEDCGSDPYRDSRNGFGACGQFCRTIRNETWDCPRGTRPVYLKNGDCTCCTFRECS